MSINEQTEPQSPSADESVRWMLARAKMLLHKLHESQLWLEYPFAAVGGSDRREVERECFKVHEHELAMGRKLLGDLGPDLGLDQDLLDDLCSAIGSRLIFDFHSELI